MTTPQIPDEAVEAASEAIFIHRSMPDPSMFASPCGCGEVYGTAVERQRHAAGAVLVAAEPYLRTTIAEEIAQAIEAQRAEELSPTARAWLVVAAGIAREVGAKANGDPT